MPTKDELRLELVKQIRVEVGPGVSNWSAEPEGSDIWSKAEQAQVSLGLDPRDDLNTDIRRRVVQHILSGLPGAPRRGFQRSFEKAAAPGQMNAALIATERYFQSRVDEESA